MSKLLEHWRRYRSLGPAERRLLWRALWWLAAVGALLRLLDFKRVQAWLGHRAAPALPPPGTAADALVRARHMAHLVSVAARFGPYRATCLPRSLTLQHLLRQSGLPAELRIGVRKSGRALEAHAWVEHAGVPLIDGPEVRERYGAFEHRFSPDRWV